MTPPRSSKAMIQPREQSFNHSSDSETPSKQQEETEESCDDGGKCSDTDIKELSAEIENTSLDDRQSPQTRKRIQSKKRSRTKGLYPSLTEFETSYSHRSDSDAGSPCHHRSPVPPCKHSSSEISWSFINIAIIALIVIAVVAGIAALMLGFSRSAATVTDDSGGGNGVIHVEDIENDMMSIFTNQSDTTWGIIRSQLGCQLPRRRSRSKTRRAPLRPASLLVVGFKNGVTLRCFSRKLSGFVAQAYERNVCIRADAEENNDSGDVAKWQMDRVVNNGYSQGDRCFHIQRLGRLSAQELLMLHAWCDGDHSPYKDSVFIFSLIIEKNATTADEKAVYSYLQDQWTTLLGPNEAPALLSRVANNIVIVNEEKKTDEFKSSCLR